METTNIAIVGAGKGGYEFLKVLLGTPHIRVKCVCDINSNAKGALLARQNNIPVVTNLSEVLADQDLDLILESTGRPEVFDELNRNKSASVSLVGLGGARVIYHLLDSYNEVNRHLQSYKINLERRIIERTEELENLNVELAKEKVATEVLYERERQLNQEKSKYLIHTTHQLKAPFAAIQNYVEIILDGYSGEISTAAREIILKIRARCELLSENIRDMLELAKLKAQVVELIREESSLQELITEVIERFQVAAETKHIRIVSQVPPQPVLCRTVHKQLFELLATLVDNAINYSPPETTVEIRLAVDASGKPLIDVADQGIGIPQEHLTKIFTEYFRSNNAVRHNPNGNGLGLAIASEIAKLLEITLSVESELGKGTTFHLRC